MLSHKYALRCLTQLLTIQLCIFLDMRHAYWTKLESQQPWTRSNDCNYLAQVSKRR